MKYIGVLTGCIGLMSFVVFGGDWPQFCGPERNNLSGENGLARSWPEQGPTTLWSVDVTIGYAGPAVKDGMVYLMNHTNDVSSLHCYSLDSGKERWSLEMDDLGMIKSKKYRGTRGTPTVTDDSLYAVTLYGTVFCVDLQSHKIKWKYNMVTDFGKSSGVFGIAQSPLLVGDLVILSPLTESHSVIALDKKLGQVVWTTTGFIGGGFVSPTLIQIDGEDQILVVAGGDVPKKKKRRRPRDGAVEEKPSEKEPAKKLRPTRVFAVSPKDGEVLWIYEGWSCKNPIPHPVVVDKNTFFLTAGYKSVSTLLRIKKNNVEEIWKTEEAASWIEQPIFVNNHVFVGGTVKSPQKGLVCINLDGEVQWNSTDIEGAPKFDHLNMLAADGMLVALDGSSGILHLIEASPTAFTELASAKVVAEKGQPWAPIALSDGKLLVRDHTKMKCLHLK